MGSTTVEASFVLLLLRLDDSLSFIRLKCTESRFTGLFFVVVFDTVSPYRFFRLCVSWKFFQIEFRFSLSPPLVCLFLNRKWILRCFFPTVSLRRWFSRENIVGLRFLNGSYDSHIFFYGFHENGGGSRWNFVSRRWVVRHWIFVDCCDPHMWWW